MWHKIHLNGHVARPIKIPVSHALSLLCTYGVTVYYKEIFLKGSNSILLIQKLKSFPAQQSRLLIHHVSLWLSLPPWTNHSSRPHKGLHLNHDRASAGSREEVPSLCSR